MPKWYFLLLFLLSVSPLHAGPTSICESDGDDTSKIAKALCLFSKPLLVGASITEGYRANPGGPVSLIAKSLNPETKITNLSRGGVKSVDSLKDHVIPSEVPSIVVGIDLFFWDAAKGSCDVAFEEQTKKFIKQYQEKNIPMILGRLPKGVAFPAGYSFLNTSVCADKINKLLEDECTLEKNCLIYDPNDCLSKVAPLQREAYFSDKLHTSEAGNTFCAQEFIAANKYHDLSCN